MIVFIIMNLLIGFIDLGVAAQFYAAKKDPAQLAGSLILSYSAISCYFCCGTLFISMFVFIVNLPMMFLMMIHIVISGILFSRTTRRISALDEQSEQVRVTEMTCENCGYRFVNIKPRCPQCKTYWIKEPEQINTKNKDIIFQIGLNFYNNKEVDKALTTFKKITKLDRKHDGAWYNVACCSAILGRPKKALDALKKAIDINKGWRDKAKDDKDFESIRDTIEFNEMV